MSACVLFECLCVSTFQDDDVIGEILQRFIATPFFKSMMEGIEYAGGTTRRRVSMS